MSKNEVRQALQKFPKRGNSVTIAGKDYTVVRARYGLSRGYHWKLQSDDTTVEASSKFRGEREVFTCSIVSAP